MSDMWSHSHDWDVGYAKGHKDGYQQGRADAIDEFRKYLKTVVPCEMPQDIWNIGVDNTCDRMLKGAEE